MPGCFVFSNLTRVLVLLERKKDQAALVDEGSKQANEYSSVPASYTRVLRRRLLMLPRAPSTILPYSALGAAAAEVSMQVFSVHID